MGKLILMSWYLDCIKSKHISIIIVVLIRPRVHRAKPPLYNMEFVIIGKTEKSKDDIKKTIQRMGGKLGSKIHDKVAAVISNEAEVERMGSRMGDARDLGIQVVPEHFLDDAKDGNAVSYIVSQSLCDWGTDPKDRIPQDDLTKSKSKSIYTKSVPKSQTLKLKSEFSYYSFKFNKLYTLINFP